jgi:triacylglycerol lipase
MKGESILTACGASYQALQRWKRKGQYVLPKEFRFVAGLGGNAYWGFVAESKETVIVAFRGTSSLFDLFTDFNLRLVPFPYAYGAGYVHRGFTELYDSKLRAQMLAAIGKLSYRKRLLLTGHSLGGALATIAALDAAHHTHYRQIRVCTFGSPKVGDERFAAAFVRAVPVSVRIANVHDMVVAFPPSRLRYVHVRKAELVDFRASGPLRNHHIRSYASALIPRYPVTYKRFRRASPDFLPVADS